MLNSPRTLTRLLIIAFGIFLLVFYSFGLFVMAQSELVKIVTAQQNANVRTMPSSGTERVGTLNAGESAVVIGEDPNGEAVGGNSLWYQVRLNNGIEGWLWSGAVTVAEVTPVPSPTPRPTLPPNPNYETISEENIRDIQEVYSWGKGVPNLVAWSKTSNQVAVGITGGVLFYDPTDWTAPPSFVKDEVWFSPSWLNTPDFEFAGEFLAASATDFATGASQIRFYHPEILEGPARSITLEFFMRDFAVNPNNPNHIAAALVDNSVAIYSATRGEKLAEILPSTVAPEDFNYRQDMPIAYSPDGSHFVISQPEFYGINLLIYRVGDNLQYELEQELNITVQAGTGESVIAPHTLVFNTDGTKLLTVGQFQDLRLIDLETGSIEKIAAGTQIGRAALSSDGQYFAYGAGAISLIDAQKGIRPPDQQLILMGDFAFSPDGTQLATVDENSGLLKVVDLATAQALHTIELSTEYVDASMSADGRVLALLSGGLNFNDGSRISFYDPTDPADIPFQTIALEANQLGSELVLHPDGTWVTVAGMTRGQNGDSQWLRLYEVASGLLLKEYSFGQREIPTVAFGYIIDIAWNPQINSLAMIDSAGNLRLWDVENWSQQAVIYVAEVVDDIAFSPDGSLIAVASDHIQLYDQTGRLRDSLSSPFWNRHPRLAFSPDGRYLVVAGSCNECNPARQNLDGEPSIELWDIATGTIVDGYVFGTTDATLDQIDRLAFSPDGAFIVAGDVRGNLRLWNLEGRLLTRRTLQFATGFPESRALLFTPDGALLIALNSPDGKVQFWSVARTAEAAATPPPASEISDEPTEPHLLVESQSPLPADVVLIPEIGSVILETLAPNTEAKLLAVVENAGTRWYQTELADGTTGWINARFVAVIGDEPDLQALDSMITAPGSFQNELGCTTGDFEGDWEPACYASLFTDTDGDGIYMWSTRAIPAGEWEVKIAIGGSWAENYGADGVREGANIPFRVERDGQPLRFTYDPETHHLTIEPMDAQAVETPPAATGISLILNGNEAEVQEAPNRGAAILLTVTDQRLPVIGRTQNNLWVQVEYAPGQSGWIRIGLTLRVDGNLADVPIVEPE